MANEPHFDETLRVTLNKLSVGTILEALEQPAPAQIFFCIIILFPAVESGRTGQTMPSRSVLWNGVEDRYRT